MPGRGHEGVSFMMLQYRALQVLISGREMVVMMTGPLLMVKKSNNVMRRKGAFLHRQVAGAAAIFSG